MRLEIRREGKGWTNAAVHRFHWSRLARDFAEKEGPDTRDALMLKAPKRPFWDHPLRGVQGAMAASIRHRHQTQDDTLRIEWTARGHYVKYVLHGTRHHGIDPKPTNPTGWLHWIDDKGSHRARHTNHPGARANPFPSKVMEERKGQIVRAFGRAVRDNVKE